MVKKTEKLLKIITLSLVVILCIWNVYDRFDSRDMDAGIVYLLAAISFLIAAIAIFKKKTKEVKEGEKVILSGKSFLFMIITVITSLYVICRLVFITVVYFDKIESRKQRVIDNINYHQTWVDNMNYDIDHLTKNHYLSAHSLGDDSNLIYPQDFKVIDINNSEVTLVKFINKNFKHPYYTEKSYLEYRNKDTIILSKERLKQSIFRNHEIRDNIHLYQDSLKKEGLSYLIDEIKYINGPSLSCNNYAVFEENDTLFFGFENKNKKAILTKITNISQNPKWHNEFPMEIYGYPDYRRYLEFDLVATGLDLEKDYKFRLHFEDSIKNEYIFLVTKKSKRSNNYYKIKRVLD